MWQQSLPITVKCRTTVWNSFALQACQSQWSGGCATARSWRVTSPACPSWRTARCSFWPPCRRWTTASTPALLSTRQDRLRRSTSSKSTVTDLLSLVYPTGFERVFSACAVLLHYCVYDRWSCLMPPQCLQTFKTATLQAIHPWCSASRQVSCVMSQEVQHRSSPGTRMGFL